MTYILILQDDLKTGEKMSNLQALLLGFKFLMQQHNSKIGKKGINWKAIILGFILAIILSAFLGTAGEAFSFLGMLIAGIAVGYMVDVNLKNGAIHGAITGAVTGIILTVLTVIVILAIGESMGLSLGPNAIAEFILSTVMLTIVGTIGGAIGTVINERLGQTVFTEENTATVDKTESHKENEPQRK